MKHNIEFRYIFSILLIFLVGLALRAQNNPDRLNYIEKYKDIAISEMERSGVPASIKLAQGILESNSGKSVLARKANNHFGMKCGSVWKGKTFYREDDDYDDQGNLLESCFRVYKNAEASFVAHSEFLRDPRKDYRYGFLFRLNPLDYKRWALGLKKAGYATNPRYPDLLIGLIEDYELYIYDNLDPNELAPTPPDLPVASNMDMVLINNIKTIVTAKGKEETVADLAAKVKLPAKRILKYNEGLTQIGQIIPENYRVFIQPKRNAFQGQRKYHYVRSDQTLFDISQLYGVKEAKLRKRNRIPEGKEAATGAKIKLRGWKVPKTEVPKFRSKKDNNLPPPTIPVRDLEQDKEVDFDVNIPSTSIDDFEEPKPDTGGATGTKPTTTPTTPSRTTNTTTQPTENTNNPTTTPSTSNPPVNTSSNYYTVKAGDTLYRLSKRFETTVPKLKEWNGLKSNIISIGQRLRVR